MPSCDHATRLSSIAKGMKREDDDTLAGVNTTVHRTFFTIFKIDEQSADWGEGRASKSYPKSVKFVNADGVKTTVFIQA